MDAVAYQPEQHYSVNGISINADSFGDPSHPPVLLIMGLATQLIHWDEEFCRMLAAEGFWVVRFDNRDIGRSSQLRDHPTPTFAQMLAHRYFGRHFHVPYHLDDMAQDSVGLMDALGIEKAHIIGVSMGGMIAQLLALDHPERVNTQTLIMTTSGAKKLMQPRLKAGLHLLKPAPKSKNAYIEHSLALWQTLHGKHYPFEDHRVRATASRALERGVSARGIARQLAAIVAAKERTHRLANVKIPSLIVHGDNDPLVPLSNGLLLADSLPNAELKVIKGMGHTLPKATWPSVIHAFVAMAKETAD